MRRRHFRRDSIWISACFHSLSPYFQRAVGRVARQLAHMGHVLREGGQPGVQVQLRELLAVRLQLVDLQHALLHAERETAEEALGVRLVNEWRRRRSARDLSGRERAVFGLFDVRIYGEVMH